MRRSNRQKRMLSLAVVGLAVYGACSAAAQESPRDALALESRFDEIIGLAEDAGPTGSPGWHESLRESIVSAKSARDWETVERVCWYGYSALLNATNDGEADAGFRSQRIAFLSGASESLLLQVQSQLIGRVAVRAMAQEYRPAAELVRQAAMAELDAALDAGEADAFVIRSALQVISNSRIVPLLLEDHATLLRWEEADGDRVAALPLSVQHGLPPGMTADDNYFRAARSAIESRRDRDVVPEVVRLLTKIDGLEVKRKNSSFHAATLADDLGLRVNARAAYRFSMDWYRSHAHEPESEYLLSRIGSYATGATGGDPERALEMLGEIRSFEARYADRVAAFDTDRALAPAKSGELRLNNWERHPAASQLLLTQVYLAQAGNVPEASLLAARFLAMHPTHPGSASVRQIIEGEAR